MRRPVSPPPRRSQDSRLDTPPLVDQLRRSSSDAYRPSFLAKLKSSSSAGTSAAVSHSRTGSNPALIPPAASSTSPTAAAPSPNTSKSARDMHRLGTLPVQGTLAPVMSNPASASSLSLASTLTSNTVTAPVPSTTDPWHKLHVHILRLFNGEPLRMPM
ncbi:hypothetical protein JB92DRAFT_66460 [Gautieria morchelliformis]|nr:hypothetical protein JB92DRAFT_66460 [Gautieria morchelliformis]